MTTIQFRSDFDVDLIDFMGGDQRLAQAARVSTVGAASLDGEESKGLTNFLASNRHGSPFEHTVFTWRISAPIFVWREFMRHRMASYNEESGRYKQLEPVFYIPGEDRLLKQVGKAGAYSFEPGTIEQHNEIDNAFRYSANADYKNYEYLLSTGIAREVARMVLPLNIYSTAYVTMNARALMNFLSLRVKDPDSLFPSYPQREIEMVATLMEQDFRDKAPLMWGAFTKGGRVSP
jgi:thymidylate synthase (FAD)